MGSEVRFRCGMSKARTSAAIAAVGTSTIDRFPSTITAPVIAPIAAAVTPSMKAAIDGICPYFLK
jgi:hypothetical protein